MFLGQYTHSFDEKGRLTIPVKYREALLVGAYVTQGFDKNLMVWTAPSFEQIYTQVNDLSITDPNARLLKRLIFSNAVQVGIDRAGRILEFRNIYGKQSIWMAAQLSSEWVIISKSGLIFTGNSRIHKCRIAILTLNDSPHRIFRRGDNGTKGVWRTSPAPSRTLP